MRIKDDIAAGIGLCTLTQAARCTRTSNTIGKAVIRRRVPAARGNSRGSRGGGAGASSGGCAPAGTHGLVVDGQAGMGAIRTAFARIEGFPRVQPARAAGKVRVAGREDHKAAGRVAVAVLPAGGPAVDGDGKAWARARVGAETGNEGSCTAWCRGSSGSRGSERSRYRCGFRVDC
jgi:hypothetical protein